MRDEVKHSRFETLRQREQEGVLTEPEQAELAGLVHELEAVEAGYVGLATERLRRQREAVEARNCKLEALVLREEALVRRLGAFLAEAQDERRAIRRELAAVLDDSQGRPADG